MTWRRSPQTVALALALCAIAIGFAAAIIKSSMTAIGQADHVIAYAAAELQGVRYLARTHEVVRKLLQYRSRQMQALQAGANSSTAQLRGLDAAADEIAASIASIPDRSPDRTTLDEVIAGDLRTLRARPPLTGSHAGGSTEAVSETIASLGSLLGRISTTAGLSNDPSIDGSNFSDAIVRFPAALSFGTQAAAIAEVSLATRDSGLRHRFAAARLLAKAQTAIEVGAQDAKTEMSIDPVGGAPFFDQAALTEHAFELLARHVTDAYVEPGESRNRGLRDPSPAGEVDRFTASSFAVANTLSADLRRVTSARIDRAQRERGRVRLAMAGGVALELMVMSTVGWIVLAGFAGQRKNTTAVRELQQATADAQLTRAQARQELLRAKAQFKAIFNQAPIGMITIDRQCKILDRNEAAHDMLKELEHPDAAFNVILEHGPTIERIFAGGSEVYSEEHEYIDAKNRSRWFTVSISPVRDDSGATLFAVMMMRDITDTKLMEAQLLFESEHDGLTGLPNRHRFLIVLQEALDADERGGSTGVMSVLFIDFNDFKTINDSFGHQAGDNVLIDAAARLRGSIRSTDFVARMGGDEFAVILHGTDRRDIETGVTLLQSVISAPVTIEGQSVASSASFGIAQIGSGYTLASQVIRDADTAMYQAKAQGGRNYVVFDAAMRHQVVRRMQLSIDLVNALGNHELELFYQPIVDLQDGKVAGCEALVRWRRTDGSLMPPDEFIPLAEENGAIIEIGQWVMTAACAQMSTWTELSRAGRLAGLRDDFKMHVNLSVPELNFVELLPNLRSIFARTRVKRDQIILEITEGIVLKSTPQVRSILDILTRDGFRLCIDDFGTGYSSLRYLNEMPLTSLKIDRAFVSNGGDELANTSIVEMLMVLSRSLDIGVVAEGVETRKQWEMLRDLGCRYGQGFLFSRPVDHQSMTMILEKDAALSLTPPPAAHAALAPAS